MCTPTFTSLKTQYRIIYRSRTMADNRDQYTNIIILYIDYNNNNNNRNLK